MTINAADFSNYVVVPALQLMAGVGIPYSTVAHDLCMGTVAQESLMGTYLVQELGPGRGVGMATMSLVPGVLGQLTAAQRAVIAKVGDATDGGDLASNLTLAVMLLRVWYWIEPDPLPPDTISGLGAYYKKLYNTLAGDATETEWYTNFKLTGLTLPAGNTAWPS